MSKESEDKAPAAPADKPKRDRAKTTKPAAKPENYCVAEGKSVLVRGGVKGPGQPVTAREVADLEALVKGGYVVKA